MRKNVEKRMVVLLMLLIVSAILSFFHAFGVAGGLYENLSWYDLITHFLGGVSVGLGALWLFHATGSRYNFGAWMLFWILVIGFSWEIFEYFGGALRESRFAFDTSIDLVMDTLGTLAVFLWERRRMIQ